MLMADGQQTGRLLLIKVSNGDSPVTYSALCGFKTSTFNMSANSVDTTTPDCANPGNIPQKTAIAGIVSRTFSGSGKFIKSALVTDFIADVIAGTQIDAEVTVPGVGTFTGMWAVTSYELSNPDMEATMEFSATFEAASALTFEAEA